MKKLSYTQKMKLIISVFILLVSCNESPLDLSKMVLGENPDELLKGMPYKTEKPDNLEYFVFEENFPDVQYDGLIFDWSKGWINTGFFSYY